MPTKEDVLAKVFWESFNENPAKFMVAAEKMIQIRAGCFPYSDINMLPEPPEQPEG